MVIIETKCRIPIRRTFGRIPWHVIPEPPATLLGAATWRIQRHVILEPCMTLQGAATLCVHFTVMIPEPHATLKGAVICRNQCHDRATLQGAIIPSAILKIVFLHILFYFLFLMQFRLWRAAAFVSSPIHLFIEHVCLYMCVLTNRKLVLGTCLVARTTM